MENLTPKQIVEALDKYIIGQGDAKRAVAIALYNRYRRMQVPDQMQKEITPKNLMMIGPTGVGKTEIARRLAKVVHAPFVKVEATKFTEVGYVGRDVESMVRDLMDVAVTMEEDEKYAEIRPEVKRKVDKKLVKLLVPAIKKETKQENGMNDFMSMLTNMGNASNLGDMLHTGDQAGNDDPDEGRDVTDDIRNQRLSIKEQLDKGLLEDKEVTIQVEESRKAPMNDQMQQMGIDMSSMMDNLIPKKMISRTLPVKEAREVLIREESAKRVDHDEIYQGAIDRTENNGIIFIDEFDKIAPGDKRTSGEVSREGVQRDILPIVEGSQVNTKYGAVRTDHILFIASGAFAESKPSDLIAELQGRFPIRVELQDLTEDDFVQILTKPDNALTKQYVALTKADGINLIFTKEAVEEIAKVAFDLNNTNQNIGARRLSTVLEKILSDILYEGPDMQMGDITITREYVKEQVGKIVSDKDLSRYIL
ncbi:ATP-dependent protease ATPase subunit HslU [Companilactobacillus sp.]|jgi:ATP-dependent HslUV protease ATP-binding subunit HslU|uniref:ATP-dependent protease ATPase subunit HslU n=1 Tax=Companilactobacillus sp. TaxID=2767905 RepID=UPI0025B9EEF3|nr:ATP-dependent protease ATPase subunit HslU [Companilactobacillus sp.]MCH4008292.1 ATP-dependent protease ATPase subunit HslU [Companilactobacillus sp.]MCH4051529.1 ATP-dependent protease ATPase subunit HslU [Companilactobacillus sp.]MCH4076235.1 ATP-dependent protease ATPase subunit HslU [Companilactobacillus sp.]MCH4124810.1 ATP-dependent protease ATPase subunit HslU [Companilactobacillus sp.]MCH4131352.1 ATP-dependent protease ATPase subunit HslU [Companilactobacillus sp.]